MVIVASPIGLKHNSPRVSNKILEINHNGETPLPVASTLSEAYIMTVKPPAANKIPITNLLMLLKFILLRASIGHNQLNTGARIIINSALTDWNQTAGISKPIKFRSV